MTTPTPTTFEFTTPAADRDPQTITVDLVGDLHELDRPKDWALTNVGTILADDVPHDARAQAILRYVHGVLGADGHERLLERALDRGDNLNLTALLDFIGRSAERWNDYNAATNTPIRVTSDDPGIVGEPVRLVNRHLDLDVTAEPPKDLVLMVLAASAGRGVVASQRWAVEFFLQAILPFDAMRTITHRLTSKNDPLDVEHLDPMVSQLVEHWSTALDVTPPANRAERRAAARNNSMSGNLTQ